MGGWQRLDRSVGSRPYLEPLVFVGLVLAYIWVVRPTRLDALKGPVLALIVAIPIVSNLVHRDRIRSLGFRLDNLRGSVREVGTATLVGAVLIAGIGALAGGGQGWRPWMATSLLLYPLWALIQQYAMQAFTYTRLRESLGGGPLAAAVTALLFASAHYPNTALAAVTAAGALVWCLLYERRPNLLTLAVSHGWLAILLRATWPAEWLHNLRIGPGYWTWTP